RAAAALTAAADGAHHGRRGATPGAPVGGFPMAIAPSTGTGIDTKTIPWVPMPTKDGSPTRAWAKLLHLDLERNFVIMLNKVAQGTVLPQHTHLSEAIGFTLSGHWSYRDLQLGPDSFGFEPTGTEHAPEYQEETVALIIFL